MSTTREPRPMTLESDCDGCNMAREDAMIREGKWTPSVPVHVLMGKTSKPPTCGCSIEGAGTIPAPARIDFCPRHRNAAQAFEALRAIARLESRGCAAAQDIARAALRAAGGE